MSGILGMMPHVTSESTKLRPWSGDRAPASWGLGDGQAIRGSTPPESRDIVRLKERYGLFIDGREVQGSDGAVFATVNPATEESRGVDESLFFARPHGHHRRPVRLARQPGRGRPEWIAAYLGDEDRLASHRRLR